MRPFIHHDSVALLIARIVAVITAVLSLAVPPAATAQPCERAWDFGLDCDLGNFGPVVTTLAWDDGNGEALYIVGSFTITGCGEVGGLARWDGSSWTDFGNGLSPEVFSLAAFDDGTGSALYAGGHISGGIVRRDDDAWTPVGPGLTGGPRVAVNAMTVFDDGTGPALYAAGQFTTAGGMPAANIAKWDGTAWSPLADGIHGYVYTLAVHDDGTGPALYVGGQFDRAGDNPVSNLARWDGQAWSDVGGGVSGTAAPRVRALLSHDDGSGNGPSLFVGGEFLIVGDNQPARHVARWDGSTLSSPLAGPTAERDGIVRALATFDEGDGPVLFAAGDFALRSTSVAEGIARWDGTTWSRVAQDTEGDYVSLTVFDDGSGPALFAGGSTYQDNDDSWLRGVQGLVRWDGNVWSAIYTGVGNADRVTTLTVIDAGEGPLLYAGGVFRPVDGHGEYYLATWDGTGWSRLGGDLGGAIGPVPGQNPTLPPYPPVVRAICGFDDGDDVRVYVAGSSFVESATAPGNGVVRWDGDAWSRLGDGLEGEVLVLAVFDDGTGPALYAGGYFNIVGGAQETRIAKWDGRAWSSLASEVNGAVLALVVYDDGTGPGLYMGGTFTTVDGLAANRIARWDGHAWSPLGSGTDGPVYALAAIGTGHTGSLYVGGRFGSAGGVRHTRSIARWNGAGWAPLHQGLNNDVEHLAVFDNGMGEGPVLIVAGRSLRRARNPSASVDSNGLFRWNGTEWSGMVAFSDRFDGVTALASTTPRPTPTGGLVPGAPIADTPQLFAAGDLSVQLPTRNQASIAAWVGCPFEPTPACPCDADDDQLQGYNDYFTFVGRFLTQLDVANPQPGSTDFDGSGVVDINDYFAFLSCLPTLAAWTPCP